MKYLPLLAVLVVVSDSRGNDDEATARDGAQSCQLQYKHMSKCAGTDITAILRALQKASQEPLDLAILGEAHGLRSDTAGGFVMASVRNPCSYYLSLWAYQSARKFAAEEQSDVDQPIYEVHAPLISLNRSNRVHNEQALISPCNNSNTTAGKSPRSLNRDNATLLHQSSALNCSNEPDKVELEEKFRPYVSNSTIFVNWLDTVMNDAGEGQHGTHGIMSWRFWETLVLGKDKLDCWRKKILWCTDPFMKMKFRPPRKDADPGLYTDKQVEAGLRSFNFLRPDRVDCWIYVETLEADLRHCLRRYEEAAQTTIDWGTLDHVLKNHVRVNPSFHPKCHDFFAQLPYAANKISRRDATLFEKFGFTSCCGQSTKPLRAPVALAGSHLFCSANATRHISAKSASNLL